jgi:hypothetical protein
MFEDKIICGLFYSCFYTSLEKLFSTSKTSEPIIEPETFASSV